ncbi:sodium-independent sulfate anion transporter [Pimephales promelas]|uniref:sodium-independent sulfate anion transporter n=1 Tax=Pimephales promelas TaxID=90988 RepID=UPI0019556ACD|nr:sodium-independent sulfate anion transporter [Pimephales promelas]XP_039538188.1 sodium-independent sulfate anion transporter [Pimephales promelas]KAG1945933.1 sodium-independent sulfate anion transporter [Pimephales promelas]KAG1945937.1 sodium-independent sulfate anion transporter [Pimephales promelas]
MEPRTGIRWKAALRSCFPILSWLPRYNLTCLKMDVIAGVTVGLTAVPQALAYAEVAGLPVQYGLYSAFMGCFIYCIFGTSKDITLGPTAIMSLLCSGYIGGEPVFAVVLTLLCGVIQAGMALLRLGFLLDFISYPVIKGFTCAAAVTIGFGQVKNILGLKEIPQQFFLQVYYTFHKIPEARVGDVILGLCCLFFLIMMTLMKNSLGSAEDEAPSLVRSARGLVWSIATIRNALVVVAATAVAYSSEVTGHHFFSLTGKTAKGLPPFKAPPLSETIANGTVITFSDIAKDLGGGLAVIPLMGVLESIAIAKAFGSQNNYRIDANQELFAIGLTNIMGSFVSAYPVTGSFGRTAVNSQTGVRTPAGGIVTGVIVLLSLAFLMPLFFFIPKASLAAVIICAVSPMMDFRVPVQLWRVKRLDLVPFMVTFLVSFWEVQYGIVGGVAVSALMLLYIMARPEVKVSDHGVAVLQLDSGLNFPVTEHLSRLVYTHALHASPPRCLVLDCSHVSSIDFTVVHELNELLKQFQLTGLSLIFTGLKPSVLKVLLTADLPVFRHTDTVDEALQLLNGIIHYDQQF